jgi:hypothetical protein
MQKLIDQSKSTTSSRLQISNKKEEKNGSSIAALCKTFRFVAGWQTKQSHSGIPFKAPLNARASLNGKRWQMSTINSAGKVSIRGNFKSEELKCMVGFGD